MDAASAAQAWAKEGVYQKVITFLIRMINIPTGEEQRHRGEETPREGSVILEHVIYLDTSCLLGLKINSIEMDCSR